MAEERKPGPEGAKGPNPPPFPPPLNTLGLIPGVPPPSFVGLPTPPPFPPAGASPFPPQQTAFTPPPAFPGPAAPPANTGFQTAPPQAPPVAPPAKPSGITASNKSSKSIPFPGQTVPASEGEQIVLAPAKKPFGSAAATPLVNKVSSPKIPRVEASAKPEVKDSFREIVETVVFVVVLVLILKTFVAEAFVIPTGSMADTLFGYHKTVICDDCGITFDVNASQEADPAPPSSPRPVVGCYCPNCRHWNDLRNWYRNVR